jgi:dihydrofolate reductase
MKVSIIVAVAENGVIGNKNKLLWRLSEDLKLFKARTLNHAVIMGRNTFESIGKPLPGRLNIVISRNKNLTIEGVQVANSFKKALEIAESNFPEKEIFVIGGDQIYKIAEDYCKTLYLTKVPLRPEGDAFFDLEHYKNWTCSEKLIFKKDEKNEVDFEIQTLKKM